MLVRQIETLGSTIIETIDGFGRFSKFASSTFMWSLRQAGGTRRPGLLFDRLYNVGTTSIVVVMLVGAFVGAVIAIETYDQFAALGQATRLGGVIGISVVKQIGPVFAAIMVAGRVGGSVSAELGTMNVTEQIDALRVMGSNPIAYLVVPRVMACLVMLPILTIFSDLAGIVGGWLVIVKSFGVDNTDYWRYTAQVLTNWDLFEGLAKAMVFGGIIGLISCYKGFYCGSGARGVGRASTEAFVTSFLAIIVANFFMATFIKNLYVYFYGAAGGSFF